MRIFMVLLLAFALQLTVSSCNNDAAKKSDTEAVDQSGPEYTSAYICPMHCEGSGSDSPGKCPVCGMDYVANESASEDHDGHDHDGHDHSGHNH